MTGRMEVAADRSSYKRELYEGPECSTLHLLKCALMDAIWIQHNQCLFHRGDKDPDVMYTQIVHDIFPNLKVI